MKKFLSIHKKNTENIFDILKDIYTDGYGGFSKIFSSFYFIFSIFLTIFMCGEWINNCSWIDNVKTIIPALLGFSLAAYTLLSTFGEDDFRRLISQRRKNQTTETLYMQANAAFVHFIIIQLLSLFLALIGKTVINIMPTYGIMIFSGISTLIFAYALLLCLATIINIYRIARVYQAYNNIKRAKQADK